LDREPVTDRRNRRCGFSRTTAENPDTSKHCRIAGKLWRAWQSIQVTAGRLQHDSTLLTTVVEVRRPHSAGIAHSRSRCDVTSMADDQTRTVYWHRDLPPLDAEPIAEHTLEADSHRVPGTIAHRDELWDECYRDLMSRAENRLVQEVARLRGDFAHVSDEAIHPKHDDAAGEAWLHGRFQYVLYRRSRPR
jgi:hypothetical protein